MLNTRRLLLVAALGLLPWVCSAHAETEPAFPITASSSISDEFRPECAFDGDPRTRWASEVSGEPQWLQIDLGKSLKIRSLTISWEAAHAEEYEIQVSDDGVNWETIAASSDGRGGVEEIAELKATGRWLRILCKKPLSYGLYSLWEVSSPDASVDAAIADARARIEEIRLRATQAERQRLRDTMHASGAGKVVFATRPLYTDGHWYANLSYFAQDTALKTYAKGGGLYVLDVATGALTTLVEDADGTVRDPAVHYDGQTVLFSWRPGGTDSFHLYTIRADGTALEQLTFGEYDDIEPAWLPDGGIVFVSSRCRRWVNCWLTQVAVIHRCEADGSRIVPLSANVEHDNTPWPLPDGRILYTRWEYVDRSQVDYHHLWTMNPDGTGQQVYFGNLHPGGLYIDAKPVPGAEDVLFINSPGHGAREHAGLVALVNAKQGPDHLPSIRTISGDGFRDPYAITEDVFLAAKDRQIVLMGPDGTTETVYMLRDKDLLVHEPRPLTMRTREPVIPSRVDYTKDTGRFILTDVYIGRNMGGVARGEIKKLLVLESLPKPINYTGGMDPLTYGGSFTLERVLGTVPVEEDGSACMDLPAGRALIFVALDAQGDSVKRMQSFCTVMPGETLSCIGCHEERSSAGPPRAPAPPLALRRPPSAVTPFADLPDVFDFPRDLQPILDRHCVGCHDYEKHPDREFGPMAGGVILSGDHGPMFSHSYAALTVRGQFVDGRDQPKSNLPPRSIGSGASPLMAKIRGGHHNVRVSDREMEMIRLWIETGAPYPGTYAALGSGSIGGYYANTPQESDAEWPASKAAAEVIDRRCSSCHTNERRLPRNLSDENDVSFWRPEWNDPRLLRSRHLVFNLTRPEKSLILLAPLAKEAGGLGLCSDLSAPEMTAPVIAASSDPDYQKLLDMCAAGMERLAVIKRFDMPGFTPPEPYLREMRRYGIIAPDKQFSSLKDMYEMDQAYWKSFN